MGAHSFWLSMLMYLAAAFGAVAGYSPACAQGGTAGARAQVVDARGLPVVGAEIRVRAAAGPTVAVGRTDPRGEFVLLGLEPGDYLWEVRPQGAAAWARPLEVSIAPGELKELKVQLGRDPAGLAAASAAQTPDDDGLLVQRTDRGASATDGPESAGSLGDLPLPGRDWEASEALSSSARDATLAGGGTAQDATEENDTASARAERETGSAATGLSFDALPVIENTQTVDGLSADQGFRGGPRGVPPGGSGAASAFAQGAVGSVRIAPRSFSVQVSGAGGTIGVASRQVRSGLHGNLFFQARESAWAAVNPFSVVTRYQGGATTSVLARPADSRLQFGGAAGSPLRVSGLESWKLALFGALEVRTRAQTLFSTPETAGFYDLSATQQALLANRGVGAAAVSAALAYLDGLTGPEAVTAAQTLGFARLDAFSPDDRDRISLGYQRQRRNSPMTGGGQFAEGVVDRAVGSIGSSEAHVDAGRAAWVHRFRPGLSNEVRFQLARDFEFEAAGTGSAQVPGVGPGGLAPQVAIEPEGFIYGTPAALGRVAYPDERRLEVADTLAWRLGRHVLAVGGEWSRLNDRVFAATNLEGSFLYDSGTTNGRAGGLVDWITDYTYNVHAYPNGACPSITSTVHDFCFRSYSQSFENAATQFVTHELAGFAEDSVRLRPDLNVTLGARWEYTLLPWPQAPNAVLDAALAGVGGLASGSTASFPEDRNNVGPRVSVAWTPGGAGGRRGRWFSVRAGYGMFFGRLPGATVDAALANTGMVNSVTSIRITPTVETECPQVPGQGFGYPCSFLNAPAGVAGRSAASVMVLARSFRLPAVQRGMLSVEREAGRHVTVRAEYATAWATQLPESVDLNVAPSTGTTTYVLQGGDGQRGLYTGQTFTVPTYTARRTALFGPVTSIQSNANATFHSGTAEVQVRSWHGWAVRGSYTFSRAIDYGPQMSAMPRQNGQFDPFTNRYDKGLSSLDRPVRFAGDLLFQSQWRGGPEFVRGLLSGWRMAAIGTAASGAPYSYGVFGGTRLAGGRESINGSGGATYLPTVGRNTLRLPARGAVDLRAMRELPLRRGWRLEVRGDAYNLLNSVNLSRVETRAFLLGTPVGGVTPLVFQDATAVALEGLSTPPFGAPLSSTSGVSRERTVELGMRLSF